MERVLVRVPAAVGVKFTVTLQVLPAARLLPHVVETIWNSLPVSGDAVNAMSFVPLFVNETDVLPEGEPMRLDPTSSDDAEAESVPVVVVTSVEMVAPQPVRAMAAKANVDARIPALA